MNHNADIFMPRASRFA